MEMIFCYAEGSEQGSINGGCNVESREGSIEVRRVSMPATRTALATDTSRAGVSVLREPIAILSHHDRSYVPLMQAMVNRERMKFTLEWYRQPPKGGGDFVLFLKHTFDDCRLTEVKSFFDSDNPTDGNHHSMRFSFNYQKGQFDMDPIGQSFTDTWRQTSFGG